VTGVPPAAPGAFGFRPLGPGDHATLRAWLERPHVRRWWGDPETEFQDIVTGDWQSLEAVVVLLDGRPIGFVQSYDVAKDGRGVFPGNPAGTRGIDILLGEADLVGRGIGAGFVAAFAQHLFARGVPRVLTDPDPANPAAVKTYARAGFQAVGPIDTPDGPALLMIKDNPEAAEADVR
jgi:aminoglycoside 6'-N-acetyltransferase